MTPIDEAEKKKAPREFWLDETTFRFGREISSDPGEHTTTCFITRIPPGGLTEHAIHVVEHSALVASQSEAKMWRQRCKKLVDEIKDTANYLSTTDKPLTLIEISILNTFKQTLIKYESSLKLESTGDK